MRLGLMVGMLVCIVSSGCLGEGSDEGTNKESGSNPTRAAGQETNRERLERSLVRSIGITDPSVEVRCERAGKYLGDLRYDCRRLANETGPESELGSWWFEPLFGAAGRITPGGEEGAPPKDAADATSRFADVLDSRDPEQRLVTCVERRLGLASAEVITEGVYECLVNGEHEQTLWDLKWHENGTVELERLALVRPP